MGEFHLFFSVINSNNRIQYLCINNFMKIFLVYVNICKDLLVYYLRFSLTQS